MMRNVEERPEHYGSCRSAHALGPRLLEASAQLAMPDCLAFALQRTSKSYARSSWLRVRARFGNMCHVFDWGGHAT